MPAAIVMGVATLYAANQQKKGAQQGAQAQTDASNAAIAEQQRQFDLTRSDQAPWMQAGQDALGKQAAFLNGDWSGFENSPDYKYALQQGMGSLDHSAAARGGLFGGGADRDRMQFVTGLATQNANGYWNKLAGMSNTGQQTASGLGNLGMNMANQIGAQYNNIGNARQSSYQQRADANSQMIGGLAGLAGRYIGQSGWGGV